MAGLLEELKRRKVLKVGAGYLVAVWLAVQAASIGFPAFQAPDWALRVFILMLLLGFPIIVVLTWLLDLTPDGVRVDAPNTGTKRLLAGAVGLAALALAWYFVGQPTVRPGQHVGAASVGAASAAIAPAAAGGIAAEAAPTEAAATISSNDKSIAVLAFTDLSPKHDQDYFSDGMAEELLNALVRIKDLRVAGRTSSFYYKGRNEDLRTIGRALGVANVLEGSVRTQGNRVRITAQLVRSSDGIHRWSKTYDGTLDDVFKLQDQIARAIADELQPVLEGEQKTVLVPEATRSPEAYALFLRATEVLNKRDFVQGANAIAWLQQALKLDPKFARAESQLGLAQVVLRPRDDKTLADAERHARAAMAADPTRAQPVYVLGLVRRYQRRFTEARPLLERAVALEPGDASAHMYLGQWLVALGYTRAGIAELDRALAIDPLLPNAANWRAWQFVFAGDIKAAKALFERTEALGLSLAQAGLGEVALAEGDFARARRLMVPVQGNMMVPCLAHPQAEFDELLAGTVHGDAAARARASAIVNECLANKPTPTPTWTVLALWRLGDFPRALALIAAGPTSDDAGVGFRTWTPINAPMRQLPQFNDAARRIGWIATWDKYGAPDLCTRIAPGTYACH